MPPDRNFPGAMKRQPAVTAQANVRAYDINGVLIGKTTFCEIGANCAAAVSSDPRFEEKVVDVVGLYLSPPDKAMVLCVDEKSQIQALDRTQPGLPMKKGRAATMTHDYKRHGTTTLFAALDVKIGLVIGECLPRHRAKEFIRFLQKDRPRRAQAPRPAPDRGQLRHPQDTRGQGVARQASALHSCTSSRRPRPGSTSSSASSPRSPTSASGAARSPAWPNWSSDRRLSPAPQRQRQAVRLDQDRRRHHCKITPRPRQTRSRQIRIPSVSLGTPALCLQGASCRKTATHSSRSTLRHSWRKPIDEPSPRCSHVAAIAQTGANWTGISSAQWTARYYRPSCRSELALRGRAVRRGQLDRALDAGLHRCRRGAHEPRAVGRL